MIRKLLAAALLSTLCISCATEESEPAIELTPKVLVVGWDGARPDAVQAAYTPAVDSLLETGSYSFEATIHEEGDSSSSPGWKAILSGVDSDKHGVYTNESVDAFAIPHPDWPSFLTRARNTFGYQTAAACDWEPLCLVLDLEDALDGQEQGTEEEVTSQMETWLRDEDYDVLFVHLDLPDHAGHDSGYSVDNPHYMEAIEQSDALTVRMLDAIAARKTRSSEKWLIILTTDHGGQGTGHGPRNADNDTIYVIVGGDGVRSGELEGTISQLDIHPTVLQYLGHPIDPAWGLDGKVIGLPQ